MSDSKFNLALLGGTPVRSADKQWPKWPQFGEGEREALVDVLENTNWWYGEHVRTFEAEYAAYQGAKYCLVCTSGTTALEICLQAMGIGYGDEYQPSSRKQ